MIFSHPARVRASRRNPRFCSVVELALPKALVKDDYLQVNHTSSNEKLVDLPTPGPSQNEKRMKEQSTTQQVIVSYSAVSNQDNRREIGDS